MDEDEVDFLDSVLESTRAEEARVKRETAEGLELFRKHQDEADKKARRGSDGAEAALPTEIEERWVSGGRKRKRAKEKEVLKGVKVRRLSSNIEPTKSVAPLSASQDGKASTAEQEPESVNSKITTHKEPSKSFLPSSGLPESKKTSALPRTSLRLEDYDSDEDDG